MKRLLLIPSLVLLASGCSLMPYEDEFACRMKNNLGKCISVSEAYEEAVTGVEKAPFMVPASEQVEEEEEEKSATKRTGGGAKALMLERENNHSPVSASAPPTNPPPTTSTTDQPPVAPYSGYRDAVYGKLQALVELPQAPMVAAPRTVRTMILPYTSTLERNRLWMPRYVYNIVQEPYFILGEYLVKDRDLDIINRATKTEE